MKNFPLFFLALSRKVAIFLALFLLSWTHFLYAQGGSSIQDIINKVESTDPIVKLYPQTYKSYSIPELFEKIFHLAFTEDNGNYIAKNTKQLGGKSAENFLQRLETECTDGQKAIGILDGKLQCGYNAPLLVKVKIHSGTPQYDTSKVKKDGEWLLIGNEPVQFTTSNEESEIVFDDNSLLRLAADTSIAISAQINNNPSATNKTTIAQAQYEKGFLWGRVLNPDIVRFSNGGLVVGVRWTSISMKEEGIVEIYQSKKWLGEPAAELEYGNGDQKSKIEMKKCQIFIPSTPSFSFEKQILDILPIRSDSCINSENTRTNTKADIAYINSLTNSGSYAAELKNTELEWVCENGKTLLKWQTEKELVCVNKNVVAFISCEIDDDGQKICSPMYKIENSNNSITTINSISKPIYNEESNNENVNKKTDYWFMYALTEFKKTPLTNEKDEPAYKVEVDILSPWNWNWKILNVGHFINLSMGDSQIGTIQSDGSFNSSQIWDSDSVNQSQQINSRLSLAINCKNSDCNLPWYFPKKFIVKIIKVSN